ncbi:MAG: hypothetical protein Q8L68_06060 [Methylococcales bacterium]|nr:hypothetical protein [Methylococcales bacterium]
MYHCRDIVSQADDYLGHQLRWRQRLGYRMHLLLCRHCRRYLNQLDLMLKALAHYSWQVDKELNNKIIDTIYSSQCTPPGDSHEQ